LIKLNDKTDPLGDIESLSFYRLMQLLCPPNDQFHGCELKNFVDTCFFDSKSGKAVEIIATNKEGFLYSIKNEKRLKFLAIQTFFTDKVRERRKVATPRKAEFFDEDMFDRQTTTHPQGRRTTFGSDFNFSNI
jgi:hypothetical protein